MAANPGRNILEILNGFGIAILIGAIVLYVLGVAGALPNVSDTVKNGTGKLLDAFVGFVGGAGNVLLLVILLFAVMPFIQRYVGGAAAGAAV